MWVMPSSSARCAQLPRAADKVPFYAALKKFRDYLNGLVAHVEEAELVFPDNTARRPHEEMEIRRYQPPPRYRPPEGCLARGHAARNWAHRRPAASPGESGSPSVRSTASSLRPSVWSAHVTHLLM